MFFDSDLQAALVRLNPGLITEQNVQAVVARKVMTIGQRELACMPHFKGRVQQWAAELRVEPKQVRLQRMTRKWASCSTAVIVQPDRTKNGWRSRKSLQLFM